MQGRLGDPGVRGPVGATGEKASEWSDVKQMLHEFQLLEDCLHLLQSCVR